MSFQIVDDLLLIGEVSEVRGSRLKIRVYGDSNEAYTFFRGNLVKGVSVGGYIKIPCGFDSVIGVIEGDYQQEKKTIRSSADERIAPGHDLERFVDVAIFGSVSLGGFDRGVSTLPLIKSKAYLLSPEELGSISSSVSSDEQLFRIGTLAGHDGIAVELPLNRLFASHIGVFGNTGSGKSNTLCRLYSDCFSTIESGIGLANTKSKFVFIDFNGEYTAEETLTRNKHVYHLCTSKPKDRIPVPSSFYFDLDIWAILSRATERTQRPLLARCIKKAKQVLEANNGSSYLAAMVENFLAGYFGNAFIFGEQNSYLVHMFSLLLIENDKQISSQRVEEALDPLEIFSKDGPKLRNRGDNDFLNAKSDARLVFKELLDLDFDYDALLNDSCRLLEFLAYFVFLEQWRSGRIVREHIAPWLMRYVAQLENSSNLYRVRKEGSDDAFDNSVCVYSLLEVNQDQKRIIPLVIAKYLYEEQKRRGQAEDKSSTHLIIDEAHNILSYSSQRESEIWRDYRLETFEEIVKEGRKFGMYLTVCSQRPADISPTVLSQMHNYFIHRLVNDEDLRAIAKSVSFIDGASMSMIPVLPQGCCIVSGTATTHPSRIQVDKLELEKQPRSYDRDLATAWTPAK